VQTREILWKIKPHQNDCLTVIASYLLGTNIRQDFGVVVTRLKTGDVTGQVFWLESRPVGYGSAGIFSSVKAVFSTRAKRRSADCKKKNQINVKFNTRLDKLKYN
jgi:hypothetical protein